ncbi:MAG: ankyrin repeat domain-containing protein [Gallionellaceae bacterium]|jgi:ankyrin repeat protein
MDDKMHPLFNINSVHYPRYLAQQYPQILNKIVELWNSEKLDSYFSDLILDTRNDQRQGFPPEVAEEILRLSVINTKYRESMKPHSWFKVPEKDKLELVNLGYKYTAQDFMLAAKNGNVRAINVYLRTRVPVETQDEESWTALMHAAACGQETVMVALLNHKAGVESKDRNGYSSLHWAAFHGHFNAVKLLLQHHANPNASSKLGWTPLMQAATQGHITAAKFLLEAGADVNCISNDHWTPLHKASANGHVDMVKLLLEKGADSAKPRHNGSTALSLSTTGKHHVITEILSTLHNTR